MVAYYQAIKDDEQNADIFRFSYKARMNELLLSGFEIVKRAVADPATQQVKQEVFVRLNPRIDFAQFKAHFDVKLPIKQKLALSQEADPSQAELFRLLIDCKEQTKTGEECDHVSRQVESIQLFKPRLSNDSRDDFAFTFMAS